MDALLCSAGSFYRPARQAATPVTRRRPATCSQAEWQWTKGPVQVSPLNRKGLVMELDQSSGCRLVL